MTTLMKVALTLIWVATQGIAKAVPIEKGEKNMEEYIASIRTNAMTVNERIAFLQQFDGPSVISIDTDIDQIDIYKDESGDLIFR